MIKKSQLIDKAIRVIATNPNATMEDIARASDVSRVTMYRYFSSIHGLYRAVAETAIEKSDEIMESVELAKRSDLEALKEFTHQLIPVTHYFGSTHVVLQISTQTDLVQAFIEGDLVLRSYFKRLQQKKIIRNDIKPEWVTEVYNSLIVSTVNLINRGVMAPNDAADFILTSLLNGIATNKEITWN